MIEPLGRTEGVQRPLAEVTAADLMSADPVTLPPSATVGEAMTLMRHLGVRHVPVVAEGRFVGVLDDRLVSLSLLTGPSVSRALELPVESAMTHFVPQVGPGERLSRVAHLLRTSRCDAVVVVDAEECLLGLITMVDVVGAVAIDPGLSPDPPPADQGP